MTEALPGQANTTFTVTIGTRLVPKARIEVDGVLDRSAAHGFRALLHEFVGDPLVVIELTGCTSVDEAGVGALAGAVHGIREAGGTTMIVGASELVRDEIVAVGAGSLLEPSSTASLSGPIPGTIGAGHDPLDRGSAGIA